MYSKCTCISYSHWYILDSSIPFLNIRTLVIDLFFHRWLACILWILRLSWSWLRLLEAQTHQMIHLMWQKHWQRGVHSSTLSFGNDLYSSPIPQIYQSSINQDAQFQSWISISSVSFLLWGITFLLSLQSISPFMGINNFSWWNILFVYV